MSMLRPLRILLPFIAIAAALVLFISVAFIAFTVGGGNTGGGVALGPCDASLSGGTSSAPAGVTVASLSDEQRRNATTIVAT
ncbi:MAG: hypothetical protein QOH17_1269, partial [Pseudonocardiales bacterium]|nr:hypothetical protein [Pseudonocardiales bacterium]